jgi:hypothetical protein
MAFSLPLPRKLANSGWKVKIHDKERCEDPHVTIWCKRRSWRLKLRDGEFLDGGRWNEIDDDVHQLIDDNWDLLGKEWDRVYGDVNPIAGEKEDS